MNKVLKFVKTQNNKDVITEILIKMKKIILFLLVFSCHMYGQEIKDSSYKFLNPTSVNNLSDYELAFSTADMSQFRFKEKSNIIQFESGLKVELFSADVLVKNNLKVNYSMLMSGDKKQHNDYFFKISDDGKYILRKFLQTEFKSKKRK